ncbi:MAG: hypothetical protein JWM26_2662 [Betaproteobacteria bacterium]|nr:hypothetical protein [Betaproteobacteria bacterium]
MFRPMLTRRHFLRDMAVLAAPVAVTAHAADAPGKSRPLRVPTINVKDLGAFGNGKLPDLAQVRAAIREASERPGGATILFPRGDYFLGAADETTLVAASNLQNVRFVGEQATISCKSVNGLSNMFLFAGCRNIGMEGLTFRDAGFNRNVSEFGAVAIRLAAEGSAGCESVSVSDCRFESVYAAMICRESDRKTGRTRGVRLTNVAVKHAVYGLNFQHDADDVVARGLRCDDIKRSYFPYGVSRHDIELESINNATGFTDVLISCYRRDTTDIRVKLKCRAKRGGDAIVYLDHQNEVPNMAIRNVALELDIDDIDCRLEAAIAFRALDAKRNEERITTRQWQNIRIDGDIRICEQTKLFDFRSASRTPGILTIGPRLARNPRLPRSFPGFNAEVQRA